MTYSDWIDNVGGSEIVVTVDVEEDEDVFLSLEAQELDLSILITDDADAQRFFATVAEAKRKWDEKQAE